MGDDSTLREIIMEPDVRNRLVMFDRWLKTYTVKIQNQVLFRTSPLPIHMGINEMTLRATADITRAVRLAVPIQTDYHDDQSGNRVVIAQVLCLKEPIE